MKTYAMIALAGLLSGCAAQPWHQTAAVSQSFEATKHECQRAAHDAGFSGIGAGGGGGALNYERKCLEAHGFSPPKNGDWLNALG